jgi:hypothetical protein
MWKADGNCLIFFAEETNDEDPKPVCRIHSQTLEEARSVFMSNLLRYGEIVGDYDFTGASPSESGISNMWPLDETNLDGLGKLSIDDSSIGAILASGAGPTSLRAAAEKSAEPQNGMQSPTAEGKGKAANGPGVLKKPRPGEITHEIWFRAPSHIARPDIQRRHHMATRNYLALLYAQPLIGNSYYEMLSDLQNVMDTYYELNDPAERWDSSQVILQYMVQRQLDDVRGNLRAALGLMAWSEQPSVRWEAGYLEGFVHASGMVSHKAQDLPEFKILSPVSRNLLNGAYEALQRRLVKGQERLCRFEFPELWYADGVTQGHPAHRSFEDFRGFLQAYYSTVFEVWPPRERNHQGRWLTRSVVDRLQRDFGALYDYIVDREVEWDGNSDPTIRRWKMVIRAGKRAAVFNPDKPGLPIKTMLLGLDTSQGYEHIPHPFPLIPTAGINAKGNVKRGVFSRLTGRKDLGPKERYQMALAYNAATNADRVSTSIKGKLLPPSILAQLTRPTENKLVDAFQTHEKSFSLTTLFPVDARLGRWIMIYSVLQVLATLSVDVEGLRYPAKTAYYTSPSLSGLPPWQHAQSSLGAAGPADTYRTALMREPDLKRSYCWLAPTRWASMAATGTGAGSSAASDATLTPPAYEMPLPAGALPNPPHAELGAGSPLGVGVGSLRHAFSAQSLAELDARTQLLRARSVRSAASGSPSLLGPIADSAEPPPAMPLSPTSAASTGGGSSAPGSPPGPLLGPAFGALSPPLLPAMPTLPSGHETPPPGAGGGGGGSLGFGLQPSPSPPPPASKAIIRPQQPTPPPAAAAPGRPSAAALGVSPNFDPDEQRQVATAAAATPPPSIPEIPRRNPHRALTVGKGQARSRGLSVDHGQAKGMPDRLGQRGTLYGVGGR